VHISHYMNLEMVDAVMFCTIYMLCVHACFNYIYTHIYWFILAINVFALFLLIIGIFLVSVNVFQLMPLLISLVSFTCVIRLRFCG
jgi:hypothetical protein